MASIAGSILRATRRSTFAIGAALRSSGASTSGWSASQAPSVQFAAPTWATSSAYSTKATKKGKKADRVPTAAAPADAGEEEVAFDVEETSALMEKALGHLQHELAGLRTGRATLGMLDHIKAEVYDEHLSLKTLGITVVRDPQLLVYSAFDPDSIPQIEKAIRESPLELNPILENGELRIPVPKPTKESLNAMKKVCRTEAEAAKVTVRHARKIAMNEVRKISAEDARFRISKEVQKLTDDYIARVEEIEKAKEKSIQDHST